MFINSEAWMNCFSFVFQLLRTYLNKSEYCVSHDIILNQDDDNVTELVHNRLWYDDGTAYRRLWNHLRENERLVIMYNGDEDVSFIIYVFENRRSTGLIC